MVDPDPDNPGVVMALASSAGGWALPARADIVVQAGPGDFPAGTQALRLDTSDIEGETVRWGRFLEKLRDTLGMASLALPQEDIALKLDEATRRADESAAALATARLNEGNAIRERDRLRADLVAARGELEALKSDNARLMEINAAGAFAIGQAPEDVRPMIAAGREHAARAQLSAARAVEAAAMYPGVIAWAGVASYSGESRNGKPHGLGVMAFNAGPDEGAYYRGAFDNGQRAGLGIGGTGDGLVWSGEWKDNEACGDGVLEAPDGRRFEGSVKPGADGAPKPDRGWTWDSRPAKRMKVHEPAPRTLPAPAK